MEKVQCLRCGYTCEKSRVEEMNRYSGVTGAQACCPNCETVLPTETGDRTLGGQVTHIVRNYRDRGFAENAQGILTRFGIHAEIQDTEFSQFFLKVAVGDAEEADTILTDNERDSQHDDSPMGNSTASGPQQTEKRGNSAASSQHAPGATYFPLAKDASWRYTYEFEGIRMNSTVQMRATDVRGVTVFYLVDGEFPNQADPMLELSYLPGQGGWILNGDTVATVAFYSEDHLPNIDPASAQAILRLPPELGACVTVHPAPNGWEDCKTVGFTTEVVGFEDVEVPAGKFQRCCKIEVGHSDPVTHESYSDFAWLAAGVGLVKREEWNSGEKRTTLYELESHSIS